MVCLGKFAYIWLTILSCYGKIPVPYGNREGWLFEHSMSYLQVRLKVVSTTFLLVCFVSLKESTREARKNVYFTSKALLLHQIIEY